jgi:hypothetical protein
MSHPFFFYFSLESWMKFLILTMLGSLDLLLVQDVDFNWERIIRNKAPFWREVLYLLLVLKWTNKQNKCSSYWFCGFQEYTVAISSPRKPVVQVPTDRTWTISQELSEMCWGVHSSLCVSILSCLEGNKQEKQYWLSVLFLASLSSFIKQNLMTCQQYVLLVKQTENLGMGPAVQTIELTARNTTNCIISQLRTISGKSGSI